MLFLRITKGFDFFGKYPEFYIKGKTKETTLIGRILTVIFIIIYIIIISYKLHRMIHRVDITFYDSYIIDEEIPSINITNENFYSLFSIFNENNEPFIEETIYYPKAYFSDEEIKEIELERCNLDKLGSKYKKLYKETDLINNYYCLNRVNYTLKSYMNSLIFKLFPCKNTTENNNHCKSKEFINEYLNGKSLIINFEDILITPLNYNEPVKERFNNLYTVVYKNFGQYLYVEMQLVKIETSTNIIGFNFFTNPKLQDFIKYDSLEIIPQPGYDLNDDLNNYPICEIEFQLNDKILSEKRQYIQLIDVLGEIGGLMEIIFSFFGVICNFIGDILYVGTITNNLFSFDINRKIILIKHEKKINKVKIENDLINNNTLLNIVEIRKINSIKLKSVFNNREKNFDKININPEINDLNSKTNFKGYNRDLDRKKPKYSNKSVIINNFEMSEDKIKNQIDTNKYNDEYIIDNIKLTDLFIDICLNFCKRRNNLYKILLNEARTVIIQKLDIFNVFRSLCSIEKEKRNSSDNLFQIKMSDDCSNNLSILLK